MTKIVVTKPKEQDPFLLLLILVLLTLGILASVAVFSPVNNSSGEAPTTITGDTISEGVADEGWQKGYYDGYTSGKGMQEMV